MTRMTFAFLALVLVGIGGCAGGGVKVAGGDIEAQKLALAKEMMQITGLDKMGPQILEGVGAQLKKDMGAEFGGFWDDFTAAIDFGPLMDEMAPLYAKHYTMEELEQLLAFQKSPVGRKSIEIMPQMMQDIMPITMKWAKDLGEKAKKMSEEKKKK